MTWFPEVNRLPRSGGTATAAAPPPAASAAAVDSTASPSGVCSMLSSQPTSEVTIDSGTLILPPQAGILVLPAGSETDAPCAAMAASEDECEAADSGTSPLVYTAPTDSSQPAIKEGSALVAIEEGAEEGGGPAAAAVFGGEDAGASAQPWWEAEEESRRAVWRARAAHKARYPFSLEVRVNARLYYRIYRTRTTE